MRPSSRALPIAPRRPTPGLAALALLAIASPATADTIHTNESISTHVTWSTAGNDHIVEGNFTISSGGILTIQDGVTVRFDNGARLNVSGVLEVDGTSGGGVVFTRRDPTDTWQGVRFNLGSSGHVDYCTIEHATNGTGYAIFSSSATPPSVSNCVLADADYGVYASGPLPALTGNLIQDCQYGLWANGISSPALSGPNTITNCSTGVVFSGCTNPSISNQTISGATDIRGGVYFVDSGEFHVGTGNVITGNTWGLTTQINSWPDLASAPNLPLAGNTNNDGLHVWGGNTSGAVPWRDLGVPYIVTSSPNISTGGSLTVDDDVTVRFDNGIRLNVSGTLAVNGTAGGGVLFTRRDLADTWQGLRFNSGSSGNVDYCTIEHATNGTGYAIFTSTATPPSISNCLFVDADYGVYSSGPLPALTSTLIQDCLYGLWAEGLSSPSLSSPNTFTDCTTGVVFSNCTNPSISNQTISGATDIRGGVYFVDCGEFHVGTGNVITGNTWGLTTQINSWPDLASAPNLPLAGNTNSDGLHIWGGNTSVAVPWRDLGVPYVVTSSPNISTGGALTVDDGVTARFDNGIRLNISGTLAIAGTAGGGVLLTRRDPADTWQGVRFNSGSSGSVNYCTIEHATNGTGYAIHSSTATPPSVSNCLFVDADYGVYASGALPSLTENLIQDCQFGLWAEGIASPSLSAPNTFTNCTTGVVFSNCSNASISNQTISGATDIRGGVYFVDSGEFHVGTGNVITGNTWGLTTQVNSWPDLASAPNLPLAGNTNTDGLHVWGGNTSVPVAWRDLGVPYIVTSSPNISAGGSLTVEDGVTARFENGTRLNVSGTLTVDGTGGAGVLFTRRDPADEWQGVFLNSGSTASLHFLTGEFATSGSGYGVRVNTAGSVSLEDCLLHQNDWGLFVATGASPSLVRCRIVDNSSYGIQLQTTATVTFGSSLAEWNDIHDNGGVTPDRDFSNGTSNVLASYVYWGTTTEGTIQDEIHHQPDDGGLGLVTFSPWTNSTHDATFGGDPTGVVVSNLPTTFSLAQNRPNPVRGATSIRYALPRASRVDLSVYDVTGRKIATLVDGPQEAGFREARWDASGVANGVYFYRLQTDGFSDSKRIVVIR